MLFTINRKKLFSRPIDRKFKWPFPKNRYSWPRIDRTASHKQENLLPPLKNKKTHFYSTIKFWYEMSIIFQFKKILATMSIFNEYYRVTNILTTNINLNMISNDWNFNSSDGTLLLEQNYRILYMYVVTWQMYWFPGLPSNSYLLFSSWFVSYIFDNFRIPVFRKLLCFKTL